MSNIYNYKTLDAYAQCDKISNSSGKGMLLIAEINDSVEVFDGEITGNPTFQINSNQSLSNGTIELTSDGTETHMPLTSAIDNLTKILIIPCAKNNGVDYKAFYDETTLKPTNHIQAVICKGLMNKKGTIPKYYHSYAFVEPIYLTQHKDIGTHSNTNLPEINVKYASSGTSYHLFKSKTSLLSILERELSIAGYKTSVEDTTWLKRVRIMDKDLLRANGIGTNESFTSATLYDVLSKIGTYINRIPKLYFNPLYNASSTDEEKKEFLLYYEEKKDSVNDQILLTSFLTNTTGYSESKGEGKDANNIVCEATNLSSSNYVMYPSPTKWFLRTGEEKDLTINSSTKLSLKLPHTIKKVKKVYGLNINYLPFNSSSPIPYEHFSMDQVECNCLEYYEWLNLDATERTKTLYFKENTNEIIFPDNLDSSLYPYRSTLYRVEYQPVFDARVSCGKGNIEEMLNQDEAIIDSENFGAFMEDYAKSNSNKDYLVGKIYTEFSDILYPSRVLVDGETEYIINQTNITCLNNGVFHVQYSYSKEEPKRSEIVEASAVKDYHAIDSSKSYDRKDEIVEKTIRVKFSQTRSYLNTLNPKYLTNPKTLLLNFATSLKSSLGAYAPNSAICKFDYEMRVRQNSGYSSTYTKNSTYIHFSPVKMIFGNNIILNISTNSVSNMETSGGVIDQSWGISSRSYNNNVKYSDEFSCVNSMSIAFHNYGTKVDDIFVDGNTPQTQDENVMNAYTNAINDVVNNAFNYPISNAAEYSSILSSSNSILISDYEINKDTFEKLNVSYRIPFEPYDKNTFFNKEFLKEISIYDLQKSNSTYFICDLSSTTPLAIGEKLKSTTYGSSMRTASISLVSGTTNALSISFSNPITPGSKKICLCKLNEDGNYDVLICKKENINSLINSMSLLFCD